MRLVLVLSFLFYFVTLQMQNHGCNGCLEKERMGLLDIKAHILSPGPNPNIETELASWVDDRTSNCCAWNRIKCSNISATSHITDLSLDNLSSRGTLSFNVSLFHPFEELISLNLSSNEYEGWIGNGFSGLVKLETLDLSHNKLSNSSSLGLNGLTSLKTLKLNGNSMSGSFSALDIQKVRRLKVLDLSYNNLVDSIEGICKMQDLVELGLSSNMFSGQIPECISSLTNLQVLDFSQNQFNGKFPSFLGNITSLLYLSLIDNKLQGSFSLSTLANHSNLQVLYISSQSPKAQVETEDTQWFPTFQLKSLILRSCNLNVDKGSAIPGFLQYQNELQFIDLSHNKLVGEFPSWLIQNNSRLKYVFMMNNLFAGNFQFSSIREEIFHLDISNNNVSGTLPKDIGTLLPGVNILNLSMNNFEGSIPTSIGNMQNLNSLDLSHNHFSGELPEQLATGCISLQKLKLSNNLFHGNIPKFSNYSFLYMLFLNDNNLNCTLKEVLENLNGIGLRILDISNNSISGEIPTSIVKLSSMSIILMANNQLEGEIPLEISSLTMLFMLDLSQNRLSGSISHLNPSILRFLYLQKNALSGSIPFTLSEGSQLTTLDLRDNNFSGNIPYWMDKFSNLRVLSLGGNNFTGHIPIQLCHLQNITIIDLSRNKIKGSIPSCFNNLSFGMEENDYSLDLPNFQVQTLTVGSPVSSFINASVSLFMPENDVKEDNVKAIIEFRTKNNFQSYSGFILEKMTGIDLSCNILTGVIPFQIGDLQQIRALNLSHNSLSGSIPSTFSNLTQIESLDLSFNNLSGEIPFQLTKLNFLSIFNVSYNNLSGMPPSTGQFGGFDEENYRGNPYLCGPLLKQKCAGSPPLPPNKIEGYQTLMDTVAFTWSFVASYVVILLGFTIVLRVNTYWRMAWFYFIGKIISKCFPTLPLY